MNRNVNTKGINKNPFSFFKLKLLLPIIFILVLTGLADAENMNISNMTYVYSGSPDNNFGGETYGYIDSTAGVYYIYIELPSDFNSLYLLAYDWQFIGLYNYSVSSTSYFDENTLTYNNRPADGNLLGYFNGTDSVIYSILNFSYSQFVVLKPVDAGMSLVLATDDALEYRPYITFDISTITISCPIGWCYLASNYSSKTLLELDNLFSTDTIQGHYNSTSQKYESHRTGYSFNQNVSVVQKEGYYYYFSSAQDVIMTPGSTPSITLRTGWNLVGNYGTSARTLSALKTSIGATATQAKYYDKILKTWVSTDSQSVPAMESFFVYVTSQTEWSG